MEKKKKSEKEKPTAVEQNEQESSSQRAKNNVYKPSNQARIVNIFKWKE